MAVRLYREFREYWQASNEQDKSPLRNNKLICPLVISNCNGTGDWCFSDATMEYSHLEGCFLLYWFANPLAIVHREIVQLEGLQRDNKMNLTQRKAYDRLLTFVDNIDTHTKCLAYLLKSGNRTESEVCAILALHLFAPLVGDNYKIDGKPGQPNKCSYCHRDVNIGDTSFGNATVWHGKADMVVMNSIVKIDEAEPELSDEVALEDTLNELNVEETHTSSELNTYSIVEEKLMSSPKKKILSQVLAQTIVNAFCCVKANKSLSDMFIPSFLVNEKGVSIHMYNCDQDKLVSSDALHLWRDEYKLDINTILYIWMTLYFDTFDKKVIEDLQKYFPCSKFRDKVTPKTYKIYREKCSRPEEKQGLYFLQPSKEFVANPLIPIPSYIDDIQEMTTHLKKKFESGP